MGQETKIEWSMNPWRGYTKASAGCKLSYAETLAKLQAKRDGCVAYRARKAGK